MKFPTRAIHAGQQPEEITGATIPPIFVSTTYTQQAPNVHKGYDYSRSINPTRSNLETCLASLEDGAGCATFASGLAASSAIFQALRPGDGVVAGHDLYGGTFRQLDKCFKPWGLEIAYARDKSIDSYRQAAEILSRPRLIWVETPSNPLLDIVDLRALGKLADEQGMLLAVDNTFATPFLQRPIALGADYSMHSATKYLGGHSDVIAGAVIARTPELLEPVKFLQNANGAIPGPHDCYLVHRGLKTLALRMEKHCDNAMKIAEALQKDARVDDVLYPGLASNPNHRLAKEQMDGFGGIVTLRLKGDFETAKKFCMKLKIFSLAESLGGVESLCNHPASMTHASIPAEIRERRGVTGSLVRLSVGIEDGGDLLNDILQALGD